MLLVRKVEGPNTVRVGEPVVFRAAEFNEPNPAPEEFNKIKWRVETSDGVELADDNDRGTTCLVTVPRSASGKTIVAMAYINSPSRDVAATTFVQAFSQRDELVSGLQDLGVDYGSLLQNPDSNTTVADLAGRATDLKYAIDDLLDRIGPFAENPVDEGASEDTPVEPVPAADKRLAIVVGHTELRPGAKAVAPINAHEYPWNVEVAKMMKIEAAARGIACKVFYRNNGGLNGAYGRAQVYDPTAIIELHFNSFSSPNASGTETLCAENKPSAAAFAEVVQQKMLQVLGTKDRGVKKIGSRGRGHGNLVAAPNIPTVLVEPFFGSNPSDCERANTHIDAYAKCLVAAFIEHF